MPCRPTYGHVMTQGTPQLLRLNLPALEVAELDWSYPDPSPLGPGEHSLTLDADSFRDTPWVQNLTIWNSDPLRVLDGAFGPLSTMTRLQMGLGELSCIPAALSDLADSLEELDLSKNQELQLSAACEATVLSLHRLRWLHITKLGIEHVVPELGQVRPMAAAGDLDLR